MSDITTSFSKSMPRPALAFLALPLLMLPCSAAHASTISPAAKEPRQVVALHQGPAGKESKQQPAPRVNAPLSELDALVEVAEDIFELAQAGKLDRIPKRLEVLKRHAAALSYLQDEPSSVLLSRLGQTVSELELALAAKNRLDTMRYANRVTLIAATVAVPYKPAIPTELSLLDYNGRELEISSELKKTEKLANIVMRMHLAWQTLMPKLVERNATKELRRFSDVMGRLELAKSAEDYSHLSRQVGVEMGIMKGIFLKPYR